MKKKNKAEKFVRRKRRSFNFLEGDALLIAVKNAIYDELDFEKIPPEYDQAVDDMCGVHGGNHP